MTLSAPFDVPLDLLAPKPPRRDRFGLTNLLHSNLEPLIQVPRKLKIIVTVETSTGTVSAQKVEETKTALRELGLSDPQLALPMDVTALPPGVFITTTPFLVAASRSTLSTPTPARPMARSWPACSSNSAVTLVALRTRSASASRISSATDPRAGAGFPGRRKLYGWR
jgi:hypothetical protein